MDEVSAHAIVDEMGQNIAAVIAVHEHLSIDQIAAAFSATIEVSKIKMEDIHLNDKAIMKSFFGAGFATAVAVCCAECTSGKNTGQPDPMKVPTEVVGAIIALAKTCRDLSEAYSEAETVFLKGAESASRENIVPMPIFAEAMAVTRRISELHKQRKLIFAEAMTKIKNGAQK